MTAIRDTEVMPETSQQNSSSPDQNSSAQKGAPQPQQKDSLLLNLLFNIAIPTLILTKMSGEEYLGTTWAVCVALAFPIAYGLKDFIKRGKLNFFSALGVLSVILTGGISLLKLDPKYLAIKEAAVPALFGLATIISLRTPWPLVRTFLYNDSILETNRIEDALHAKHKKTAFEQRLVIASWLVAGSFFLSSVLNFLLATLVVTGQPGSVEYNEQLGKMTALSFPVIALPAMLVMIGAMIYLFTGITRYTGLALEDIVRHKHSQAKP